MPLGASVDAIYHSKLYIMSSRSYSIAIAPIRPYTIRSFLYKISNISISITSTTPWLTFKNKNLCHRTVSMVDVVRSLHPWRWIMSRGPHLSRPKSQSGGSGDLIYRRWLLKSTMTQEKRWPPRPWRSWEWVLLHSGSDLYGKVLRLLFYPHWNKDDRELNVIWANGLGGFVPINPHIACKGFKHLRMQNQLR
jgi:hypothetical protein